MKEGWEYKKLGEVISHLRTGLNPRTHFKLNTPDADGYYITVRELKGFAIEPDEKTDKVNSAAIKRINERSNLKIGDVLFSGTGTIGKTALVSELPNNWNIKEGVYAMTPKHSELDSKFFIYYIGSEFFLRLANDKAAGTGVRSIPMKELVKLPIHLPPLSEQQSIVDYLDSAFAKIDAMKANAEKALNEAKALFQASLKEMLEPKEGWEEKALKDFAIDMYRGSGVKRDQVTEDGIPCVRYGEIYTKYNYHFNECDSHTLAEYVNSPKYFEYGDILFAITGESVEDIGKSIAYTGKDKCIAGGDMVVMKHSYEPRYISYALSTPSAIKQKGHGKTKLKVVHTNIPSLKEIIIPIAPIKEQTIIADTLDSLKSKVDQLQANFDKISQECDALEQAILRQVFE